MTTIAAKTSPKVESQGVIPNLGDFVRLDSEGPRVFKKEVLRVWEGVDPNTGRPLKFSLEDLGRFAKNTNRWISIGHEVDAPDGHTNQAMASLGKWQSFEVEGDKLFGKFEAADDDVASKVGTRLRGVSIFARGPELASNGETFDAVILHCCLTNSPVLPGQSNFVRLAREDAEDLSPSPRNSGPVESTMTTKTTTAGDKVEIKLATGDMPPAEGAASAGMTWTKAGPFICVLLGLAPDADPEAVISCLQDDTSDTDVGAGVVASPAYLARLEREKAKVKSEVESQVSKRVEKLELALKTEASESAEREILLARASVKDGQPPIGKDVEDKARALFATGDKTTARMLLELSRRQGSNGSLKVVPSEVVTRRTAKDDADFKATNELVLSRGGKPLDRKAWDAEYGSKQA